MSGPLRRPDPTAVGALAAVVAGGAGMAIQSAVNSALGAHLGSPMAAAWFAFVSGFALISLPLLFSSGLRRSVAVACRGFIAGAFPRWYFLNGLAGALVVIAQAFTVSSIGVAMLTVAMLAGQVAGGLIVDKWGIGGGIRRRLTPMRLLGTFIVIVALVVSSWDRFAVGSGAWLAAIPFLAGFAQAFQQAANGQLRSYTGKAVAATWVNFLSGLVALTLAFGLSLAFGAQWPQWSGGWGEWWMLTSSIVGVAFILISALAVGHVGVLMLNLTALLGQLVGSVVIDLVFPQPGVVFSGWTAAGLVLVGLGVSVASLPSRFRYSDWFRSKP